MKKKAIFLSMSIILIVILTACGDQGAGKDTAFGVSYDTGDELYARAYIKNKNRNFTIGEPGLYHKGSLRYMEDGQYVSETMNFISWEELEEDGIISMVNGDLSIPDDEKWYSFTERFIPNAIILPDHITVVSGKFFDMVSVIEIPEGVKCIGREVFHSCDSLKSVSLPDSLEEIGEYAFADCQINELNIPSGVKKIGEDAFCGIHHIIYKGTAIYKNDNKMWGAEFMNLEE